MLTSYFADRTKTEVLTDFKLMMQNITLITLLSVAHVHDFTIVFVYLSG